VSAPELITRATLAAGVSERWADWCARYNPTSDERFAQLGQLKALPQPPDPDAVDKIIGNRSWTAVPTCNGCEREELPAVAQVGEPCDYESRTAFLCVDCLREALRLIEAKA
jgi:hypothetical protein